MGFFLTFRLLIRNDLQCSKNVLCNTARKKKFKSTKKKKNQWSSPPQKPGAGECTSSHWCWTCVPVRVTWSHQPSRSKALSPVSLLPMGPLKTHAASPPCGARSCSVAGTWVFMSFSASPRLWQAGAHTERVSLTVVTPAEKPSQTALFCDRNYYLGVSFPVLVAVRVLWATSLS